MSGQKIRGLAQHLSGQISNAMVKFNQILRVHVELTTRCNARCPMCMRNYRGLDYNSGFPLTELNLEQFSKILTPAFLKQLKQGISFNGNLGDFGLAKDALKIVQYLVAHDIKVYINTNGAMRTPDWWARLALPRVTIGWAIDGLADTHHLYRQDTDWHRLMENAKAFIAAGGQAIWRFIPFQHNLHQAAACEKLASELGFIKFENIGNGRDTGPVFNRTGQFSHWLGEAWGQDTPNAEELVTRHITWYDRDQVKVDPPLEQSRIECTHIRKREIYLAADGSVYPCCFLGFYPQTMAHPGNSQLKNIVQENNALEHGLEHCLAWFDRVEETWNLPSIDRGRLYTCVTSCGSH